jgi:hypothetical protein
MKLAEADAQETFTHCGFWLRHLDDYIRGCALKEKGSITDFHIQICFNDEIIIQNVPNNPDGWAIRRPYEKYKENLVSVQSHIKPTISIMFRGGITRNLRPYLIPMTRDSTVKKHGYGSCNYRKALIEGLLPFLDEFEHFQQDSVRVHITGPSINWLLLHGIILINWPAYSPNLNSIEHIWKLLKARLRKLYPEYIKLKKNEAAQKKLIEWIKEAWAALPDWLILKLTTSAANRLRACKRTHS